MNILDPIISMRRYFSWRAMGGRERRWRSSRGLYFLVNCLRRRRENIVRWSGIYLRELIFEVGGATVEG